MIAGLPQMRSTWSRATIKHVTIAARRNLTSGEILQWERLAAFHREQGGGRKDAGRDPIGRRIKSLGSTYRPVQILEAGSRVIWSPPSANRDARSLFAGAPRNDATSGLIRSGRVSGAM